MKFDPHTHTNCSDGANSPEQIIDHAGKIGLEGIAITDHDEVEGSRTAEKYVKEKGLDIMVIPGVEVSSAEGHILCLGSAPRMEIGLAAEDVIERIHQSGGIAIAVHPYDSFRGGVGDLVYKLDFDAVEVYNGHTIMSGRNINKIADELGLPKTGGSDAHSLRELGNIHMFTDDEVTINSADDVIDAILNKKTDFIAKTSVERMLDYGAGFVDRIV